VNQEPSGAGLSWVLLFLNTEKSLMYSARFDAVDLLPKWLLRDALAKLTDCNVSNRPATFCILEVTNTQIREYATMRHVLNPQLLDALRDSLRDVESLKLIPKDDPQVAVIRNDLRKTITEIENGGAPA